MTLPRALQEFWRRLSRREQQTIGWGALAAAAVLLYLFVVDPVQQRLDALDRLIPQKRQDLEQLVRLGDDYHRLNERMTTVDRRVQTAAENFSLLAFVESTAQEQVGKNHLAGIRPQPGMPFQGYEETVVQVQLEKVSLAQITGFLAGLERSSSYLRVKAVDIKSRFKPEEQLDATIDVAAYHLKAAEAVRPAPSS